MIGFCPLISTSGVVVFVALRRKPVTMLQVLEVSLRVQGSSIPTTPLGV